MDDLSKEVLKRSSAPGWDHPPRLLTRHGMLPLPPAYAPVPAWEKQFVTVVCGIPWKRLLETKKLMSVYKNIVDWDDSGARENLENAKARFWAEWNGLRCDIPPPEPDLYLDNIVCDAEIDSDLLNDLENPLPTLPVAASHGWDYFFSADKRVPATGLGDGEHPVQPNWEMSVNKLIVPTGWVDEGYSAPQAGYAVLGFSAAAAEQGANKGLNDPQAGFVIPGFSEAAAEQEANNVWNGHWKYTPGWEPKNSGDFWNYIADGQQNNLCGVGQDWRNKRNNVMYDFQPLASC